jgi:glutaminyl-tRNA synthetase
MATLERIDARRKVKATLHWVSAPHAVTAGVRLYDHLFAKADPDAVPEGGSFLDNLNLASLEVLDGCKVEASLADARPGLPFQFECLGYYAVDAVDSKPGAHLGTAGREARIPL